MQEVCKRQLAALIVTLFLAPAAAVAQQAEQQLPEVRVQDITVREGYRARDAAAGVLGDRPLIDTPYSINVIPRQLLENQQAAVPNDILKNDPSATLGNLPIPFFSLRGFAVGTDGFLYDGLPGHIGLSGARGQIEGIERIEVLKGPSAFLNGFGAATSLGGALNYVPKRPGNTAVRDLTASYTSRSLFGLHRDLGDRFGAERQFGYRVNLAYKDGEQAVSDARWTHEVATLALDWRATPNVLLNAGFDYVNNHTPRFQPFFSVAPGFSVPRAPKLSRNLSQPWTNFRQEDTRGYLRADWAFAPDWSFTANYLTGHTWRPTTFGGLNVLLNNAGDFRVLGSRNIAEADYQSGQALVRGRLGTGTLKHELTAGVTVSWLDQKGTPPNVGTGVLVSNLYAPSFFPDPFATPLPAPRASQKFTATGLVLSDVLSFSEQWSVLAGARHAR
ncbi:MAG: TonB-dependent siderophore receptor, partial [Sphingosinicella sp.]